MSAAMLWPCIMEQIWSSELLMAIWKVLKLYIEVKVGMHHGSELRPLLFVTVTEAIFCKLRIVLLSQVAAKTQQMERWSAKERHEG